MHIFPQLVKSMHIFSPIDLKYTKLKKKAAHFSLAERNATTHYNKFWVGKKYKSKWGGGQKYEFQI